jgi:hypothetical protein
MTYRVICAWCYRDCGPSECRTGNSHGICPECEGRHFPEAKTPTWGPTHAGAGRDVEADVLAPTGGSYR